MPVAPRRSREGTEPRGGQRRERQFSKSAKKTGKGALKARLPGSHSYQPVILAEFLVAVVVVAVSPVAKGGTPESQAKGSPAPYSVNTLKQLVAIGVLREQAVGREKLFVNSRLLQLLTRDTNEFEGFKA